ncbi:MAG: zinc metalloprotease HtpX [Candidatus Woesearchaeota archaeon]
MKKDFYDHIAENKAKSFLILFLFSLFIIFLGYIFGIYFFGSWISGAVIAFVIAIIYCLFAYFAGDSAVLSLNKAKKIAKKDDPYLWNTVEGLSIAAGLPMPAVYLVKEDSANAFATGRDPKHASIAVTTGLRDKMNREELEGVLAHEMSHVGNYDVRYMILVAMLVGVIAIMSDFMLRSFFFGGVRRDEKGGGNIIIIVIAILLAILAPLIAQLMKLSLSRKREFLADATAAKLTRNPHGLASALKKIKNDTDKVVDTANKGMAHLYIENPLRHKENKSWIDTMFSTHPPIDERIKRLEEM